MSKNINLDEVDAKSQLDTELLAEDKTVIEQKQTILNNSGVLQAYEYFLRKLCKEGFPQGNVYEYAAQQVLKYEKKKKAEQFRQQTLKKSVAEMQSDEKLKAQYLNDDKNKSKSPNKSPEKGDKKKDSPRKDGKADPKKDVKIQDQKQQKKK